MGNSGKFAIENIIRLTKSSERKFKEGNYKGAIDDKREVKSILNSKLIDEKVLEKYKKELNNIYHSKFDLIFDHKLRINESDNKNIRAKK